MTDRSDKIRLFLDAHSWGQGDRRPLAGDASFRRYERLENGARRAVLMDAPPPREDVRPFLTVARNLAAMGYSVPEIYARDEAAGLLLLEDFGDDTYTRLLGRDGNEHSLYALAVDLLIDLHRQRAAVATADIPPYTMDLYELEHALLPAWFLPEITGAPTPDALREEYMEIWRGLFAVFPDIPQGLILRDYHVDNLMFLSGRDGLAACGLLDFQDAVTGPLSYDLVSLLEDARRDISPALAQEMMDRYLSAFPDLDPSAFRAACALHGAQRHCKVIGLFVRLYRRDGKGVYLEHIPRLWRLLEGNLAHPVLSPLKDWIDRHFPPSSRDVPAALRPVMAASVGSEA